MGAGCRELSEQRMLHKCQINKTNKTMEKNEILAKLQDIIRETVDDEDVVITMETVASDVDGWDSLVQVMIVGEIRNVFGVKLTSTEIATLENVGSMVEAIAAKIQQESLPAPHGITKCEAFVAIAEKEVISLVHKLSNEIWCDTIRQNHFEELKWWDMPEDKLKEHIALFQQENVTVEELEKHFRNNKQE